MTLPTSGMSLRKSLSSPGDERIATGQSRISAGNVAARHPMHLDIATLLFALTVCMVSMAIALPAVMGRVNEPARAQAGVIVQGVG